MSFALRDDLFFEALGDGDLLEFCANGLIAGAVLVEPTRQFRISSHHRQRFGKLGIILVGCAGPVGRENFSSQDLIHEAPFPDCP